ncbi:hypothetical protein [Lunatibacter salilacus]|uniref:hypothetical protein n=1 Tax=Lunatibacter salilacus TaxID=2483804 RepID=UPI00131C89E8|nr:hypothetical protein [Lunatibacter salilacus]
MRKLIFCLANFWVVHCQAVYSQTYFDDDKLLKNLHFTDFISTLLSNIHLGFQMGGRTKTFFRGHLGFGYAVTLHNGVGDLYPSVDFGISRILNLRKK